MESLQTKCGGGVLSFSSGKMMMMMMRLIPVSTDERKKKGNLFFVLCVKKGKLLGICRIRKLFEIYLPFGQ